MTKPRRRILVLFAHPAQGRSEVNIHLFRCAANTDGVTAVDLYREYPTHHIDIDREQRRLIDHDAVIFLFPLYWYSTPALLKDWQDLVLEYGFAYGKEGRALQGKLFCCALTAGGPEKAYRAEGFNHFTIRQLLCPLEQTADLCGMRYLAPFTLLGARTAVEEERLQQHVRNWQLLLRALADGRLDLRKAAAAEYLNNNIEALMGASP